MKIFNFSKKEQLDSELIPFLSEFKGQYFVRHPLFWSKLSDNPFKKSESNFFENEIFRNNKKLYEEYLRLKNYGSVLFLISKPTRLDWFSKYYNEIYEECGEDEYYSMLEGLLTDVEFHHYTKHLYSELINIGSDPLKMMDEEDKIIFDELPDRFLIYRGISFNEKITRDNFKEFVGNSWTLDKNKSRWFSERTGQVYKVVLSIEISKNQVIFYFNSKGENEIFVDFKKLDYSKIIIEEL